MPCSKVEKLKRVRARALVCLVVTAGWLVACRTPAPPRGTVPVTNALRERDRDCLRYTVQVRGPYHQDLADPLEDPLLDGIPSEARRSARAAGLEPVILAIFKAQQGGSDVSPTDLLNLQQQLFVNLMSFDTQLQSLLTEVDCTDDVIEDLSAQLQKRESDREIRLTLASIVVAATAGIAAGAWQIAHDDSKGPPVVAIVGGAGSAALGAAALIPKQHTIPYLHPHNLLATVASGRDDDRMYPTFVRRLLYTPVKPGQASPREELLQTFEQKIAQTYPESERARVRELLYGKGAIYDQRLIDLRESMYDALESKLSAFARELELLSRYLVRIVGFAVGDDDGDDDAVDDD
jgi:hypothetical protein